jgi:hypothetical protein
MKALAKILVGGAVGVALIGLAPSASAGAAVINQQAAVLDSQFIAKMHAIGIKATDAQILGNAGALCQDAANEGDDGVQQVAILQRANPALTVHQAVAFTNIANRLLCPNAYSSYWINQESMGEGGGGGGAPGGG